MRKIKLIWDFRGPDSKGIAEHHKIHLGEFATREKLPFEAGVEGELNHWMAFIIIDEANMKIVRDALRPHRGVLAE